MKYSKTSPTGHYTQSASVSYHLTSNPRHFNVFFWGLHLVIFSMFLVGCKKKNISPPLYNKTSTYQDTINTLSVLNNFVVLETKDFADKPLIKMQVEQKIKAQLSKLGYNVIADGKIERLAGILNIKPEMLFRYPYKRKIVDKLGVSGIIQSSLVDYKCLKNLKVPVCSFSVTVQINGLKEGKIIWSGSSAFSDSSEDISYIFNKNFDLILGSIPAYGGYSPRHPLDEVGNL